MTLILKGLAAMIAVVVVGHGGVHAPYAAKAVRHETPRPSLRAVEPDAKDTSWLFIAPPTPVAAPAALAAPSRPAAQAPAPAPAPAPRPAPPAITIGSSQQALINADRRSAGLGPLTWSSCLAGIAYQNAVRMANAGAISHAGGPSQDLGCGLGHQAGENVGYWSGGISDGQLNTMFMNSPDHRANIMGPYRYIGTAWVVARNGYAYIAVEFS